MSSCPSCDEKYAVMKNVPSEEHDKKIMEEPPDVLACPECGSKMASVSTEDGNDWKCRSGRGGCGYGMWRSKDGEYTAIPAPDTFGYAEAHRYDAWSRYHRHQEGFYEYD